MPKDVSLNIFYSGLDMKSALELNIASGGWFAHTTLADGREVVVKIQHDGIKEIILEVYL